MERRSAAARGRRSKSLSRFPPPTPGSGDFETPRGRFVNKARGSGQVLFRDSRTGEVSLDDLADEFLRARAESEEDEEVRPVRRGRAERRISLSNSNNSSKGSESSSGARYLRETASSKQRGRSASRPPAVQRNHQSVGPTRARYSSVSRQDETNISQGYNNPKPTVRKTSTSGPTRQNQLQKQTNSNRSMNLNKSMSRKNSFHSHDSSSTHSSLTDDEARDIRSSHSNTSDKTIHAVYPTKESEGEAGLYEVMRMEVRNAVEEIRTQLEKVMIKPETSDNKTAGDEEIQPIQVIAELRRNYTSKLEESEKRKQELLAELAAEEQRGNELTQIVKELLPTEKPTRSKTRSRERTRVSRHLTEEAERYFEDFLSNVDDTDFSSFDGERSDTSSFNPKPNYPLQEFQENNHVINPKPNCGLQELQKSPGNVSNSDTEADGVVLPWLQWETTPSPSKTLIQGDNVRSSHDSWSPENGRKSTNSISTIKSMSKFGEMKNNIDTNNGLMSKIKGSSYCKDDYLHLRNSEDFICERLRMRNGIESGRIVLCKRIIL
ncbi:hypothetical protein LUZ60_017068 [Juncus effusus]|nr:hypothetical protein LUZ60_017068 [Juncus effusus]